MWIYEGLKNWRAPSPDVLLICQGLICVRYLSIAVVFSSSKALFISHYRCVL